MGDGGRWDSYQLKLCVHVLHDKLNGNLVVAATWHDNVGMYHCGRNVIAIRRFHHTRILFDDTFYVTASHRNISGRRINELDRDMLEVMLFVDFYLFRRLAKRISASVSTKTFISSISNTSWL